MSWLTDEEIQRSLTGGWATEDMIDYHLVAQAAIRKVVEQMEQFILDVIGVDDFKTVDALEDAWLELRKEAGLE